MANQRQSKSLICTFDYIKYIDKYNDCILSQSPNYLKFILHNNFDFQICNIDYHSLIFIPQHVKHFSGQKMYMMVW